MLLLRRVGRLAEAPQTLPPLLTEIHVLVAPQRVRKFAIGQQQRDKAAVVVGGIAMNGSAPFEGHPARGERILGDAQQQHPGLLQPFVHFQRDDISRPDDPLVKPHAQPRAFQPFRQPPHARLVFRVMAEEDVESEVRAHIIS